MSFILTEQKNNVLIITLNRADKFNSFNREMALQLIAELDKAEKDKTVRAIVLTGTGKAFCAGQDLAEAIDPNGPGIKKIVDEHYNPIILRIRNIEKPIIASINGVAAGAGANIALACDITIAKKSASFIQAFSKIGLIPDSGGTYFLPRIIGSQKAMALFMTGEKITGEQADQLNMIYKAVDDELFDAEVNTFSQSIALMPTRALGLTKKAVNESYGNTLTEQLALEETLQTEAGLTYDFSEGVNAFLEKRKPVFKGE